MADTLQLSRIQNFYGGITINDKDKTVGICSNIEEMDIFSNLDYMEPNTIFTADETITRRISGYTLGDMNDITAGATLYALGRDTTETPLAQLWRKTSVDSTTPSAWSSVKISARNSLAISPILWHRITVPVTSITRAGTTATLTSTTTHGLTTNNVIAITVSGADQVQYNGTYKGTVTGSTTITYTIASDPGESASSNLAGGLTLSFALLYYVTGTRQMVRAEITDSTSPVAFSESINDIAGTNELTLPGLTGDNDRIPMIRYNGEGFVGHGRYIGRIGTDGVFTPYAFTLPNGWQAVSFAPHLKNLAIMARPVSGDNFTKIFYWDLAATSGALDETLIPTGGAQIINTWNESLWVICARNNKLSVYMIVDKGSKLMPGMSIGSVATETTTQPVIPDATKFVNGKAFYFGLYKTDKSGLYAIGQVEPGRPYALVLSKRFHTSDYTLHTPYASISVGDNWYASFDDNATASVAKGEGTSQTRSSNAVYETIWIDLNKPETPKEWLGFLVGTKPIPANCSIVVDSKVDNASSYDTESDYTLSSSNDQADSGITADTFWEREWISVIGRAIRVRLAFTSSTTTKASVYFLALLSRDMPVR